MSEAKPKAEIAALRAEVKTLRRLLRLFYDHDAEDKWWLTKNGMAVWGEVERALKGAEA